MFSPSQPGGPAMATRSRRRQRPLSSDNSLVQQPKAKRQRLPLTEHTFVDPENRPEMLEVKSEKIARLSSRSEDIENSHGHTRATQKEISVRPKKPKQGDRASKGDGSVLLASTSAYTVSKLPGLPDRVRADTAGQQCGNLYAVTGYGLNINHTHAAVWPYNTVNASPETFVFTLPYPSKRATDPLPLGVLVAPSAAIDEPGLLIVMPASGRITYWEHISSASTLDFMGQQRTGVEQTIPGLSHGEIVLHLEPAGPGGLVLALSSGRVAHLSVRDGQGRPALTLRFLGGTISASSGIGLLGSIRQVLKQAVYRGEIAAVRTAPSQQAGATQAVVATQAGRFQAWKFHRGGQQEAVANVDARESITDALASVLPTTDANIDFELLDFAFIPIDLEGAPDLMESTSSSSTGPKESQTHLMALVALSARRQSQYALVEVTLRKTTAQVGLVRTISSYPGQVNRSALVRPRLYLPRPNLVAFLVFDKAVVIASLATVSDTPESQLQYDNHLLPASFEDVIDLKDRSSFEIVGSGIEEPLGPSHEVEASRSQRLKSKSPRALLLIRGVGVVRITLTDVSRFTSDQAPTVTAKNKLEQAVFYGSKDDNPLTFDVLRDFQFMEGEVEKAALELSAEILNSTSHYLSAMPASMDHNLRQRSTYLERLMGLLNKQDHSLSSQTRWSLLYNAEKMEMAGKVWNLHEQFLGERADDEKKTIISEIVEFIHEEDKSSPNRAMGQVDRARHWLLHDVDQMGILLPWTFKMIKDLPKSHHVDASVLTRYIYEGMTVMFDVTHGAMAFRARNMGFYGIESATVANADPKPWTSTFLVTSGFKRLLELSHKWLTEYYPPEITPGAPDPGLIELIRERLPDFTNQYLLCFEESLVTEVPSDDSQGGPGVNLSDVVQTNKNVKILMLKEFGLTDEALAIAQRHGALEALAELAVGRILERHIKASRRGLSRADINDLKFSQDQAERDLLQLFDKHGYKLAFMAYQRLLKEGGIEMVTQIGTHDHHGFYTEFLRKDVELRRIAWINEVETENNLDRAAETLMALGLQQEDHIWSKKVELSLSKLALLASEGPDDDPAAIVAITTASLQFGTVEKELELIGIQDQIHGLVMRTCEDALDDEARLGLAVKGLAPKVSNMPSILRKLIEEGLRMLFKRTAMRPLDLINLLTLADFGLPDDFETHSEVFFLALQVAELGLHGGAQVMARQLIWRRAYNCDDWNRINHTEEMDDRSVVEALSTTQPYYTTIACITHYETGGDGGDWFVTPANAYGVFSHGDYPDYQDNATSRVKMVEAMKWEDSMLKNHIDKHQLSKWALETRQIGEQNVIVQLDEETAESAGNGLDTGKTNGHRNGHSNGNGYVTNGFH